MKRIVFIFFLVCISLSSFGQWQKVNIGARPNDRTGDTLRTAMKKLNHNDSLLFSYFKFNGNRAVTRSGLPAINTGDTSLIAWINNYFFPSVNPQVAISATGSANREYMSAGADLTVNITWSVTRPVACMPISSITVLGVPQIVNPINEGQTQYGNITNATLQRNVYTNYSMVAVASDGKSATTYTSVTWYWSRYWGAFTSSYPPTDSHFAISDGQILALTGAGVGSGSELSTTRVKTYNGINAGGNYLVFAWPTSWGTPTFVINGLINTAFTKVRSNSTFVNSSGGSTNYDVWVSNTTQAGAISQFQIN